eukprot:gene4656-4989_t
MSQVLTGNVIKGYNGEGLPATSSLLPSPFCTWGDTNGIVYIADRNRIRKVVNGTMTTLVGTQYSTFNGDGYPGTSTNLAVVTSVWGDSMGSFLYFSDVSIQKIRRYSFATGIVSSVIGSGATGLGAENVTGTSCAINSPYFIYGDSVGNIFYSDQTNHRIRKYSIITTLVVTIVGTTGGPGFNDDNITGTSIILNNPAGLWGDSDGNIIFSDRYNYRIRKWTRSTQRVITVAGTGAIGFNGDSGPATLAKINTPLSVYVDKTGIIYFLDSVTQRIRYVMNGIINSLMGGITGNVGTGSSTTDTGKILASTDGLGSINAVWVDSPTQNIYFVEPSSMPSRRPINRPTTNPISSPTLIPTSVPSSNPSTSPSRQPSSRPTIIPISAPTYEPTTFPSNQPSSQPTLTPSSLPSSLPNSNPSVPPSMRPISCPSALPTTQTQAPLSFPTSLPSISPSATPNAYPTLQPSTQPSSYPTSIPSTHPSQQLTSLPTRPPTVHPTNTQTRTPSCLPTALPTTSLTIANFPTTSPSQQSLGSLPQNLSIIFNDDHITSFIDQNNIKIVLLLISPQPSLPLNELFRDVIISLSTLSTSSGSNNIILGDANLPSSISFPTGSTVFDDDYEKLSNSNLVHSFPYGLISDQVGRSLASAGDVNKDGVIDILLGDFRSSKVYVFFGNRSPLSRWKDMNQGYTASSSTRGDSFGWAVSGISDFNEDGIEDWMSCAIITNRCYILYGQETGNTDISVQQLTKATGFTIIAGVTSSQPFLSSNTSMFPTNIGSPTNHPSHHPTTSIPSRIPTRIPSLSPTFRQRKVKTIAPTASSVPTLLPTYRRTSLPSQVPTIRPTKTIAPSYTMTRSPSTAPTLPLPPSVIVSSLNSNITTITQGGIYSTSSQSKCCSSCSFLISTSDDVTITPQGNDGCKQHYYKILPLTTTTSITTLVIQSFNIETDIIDLTAFSYLHNLTEVSYSNSPAILLLFSSASPDITQKIILPSLSSFSSLTASNFIFTSSSGSEQGTSFQLSAKDLITAFAFMAFLVGLTLLYAFRERIIGKSIKKMQQETKEDKSSGKIVLDLHKESPDISHYVKQDMVIASNLLIEVSDRDPISISYEKEARRSHRSSRYGGSIHDVDSDSSAYKISSDDSDDFDSFSDDDEELSHF